MKRTIGPWGLNRPGATDVLSLKNGTIVAREVKNPADARLISAAPAMLGALMLAREHVQWAAEMSLANAMRLDQEGFHGSAADARKAGEMRLSAMKIIQSAIDAANGV